MNEFVFGGLALLIAFTTTLLLTKTWIKVARKAGIVGKDVNKQGKPKVVESGGVAVILGFVFSLFLYIFFKIFYLQAQTHLIEVFAVISAILMGGFLGFVDDILGWKIGLRQMYKPLLTIPMALPLMVINAGHSFMNFPLLGQVELDLIYPLVFIPVGIIGAANGFNLIAGFNSLEGGMGAIILSTLGLFSWFSGDLWLSLVCFSMVFSILGFLVFNKYPSKIFPGDSFTYPMGALIAMVVILGNMERIGLIVFIPYFIEFLLKARSKFRAESFGKPTKTGLKNRYKKIYSLNHLFLRKFGERGSTLGILCMELIFVAVVFLLYF